MYVQKCNKASPFARAAVLRNPLSSETVISKIQTLQEKLGMGNRRHTKHDKI